MRSRGDHGGRTGEGLLPEAAFAGDSTDLWRSSMPSAQQWMHKPRRREQQENGCVLSLRIARNWLRMRVVGPGAVPSILRTRRHGQCGFNPSERYSDKPLSFKAQVPVVPSRPAVFYPMYTQSHGGCSLKTNHHHEGAGRGMGSGNGCQHERGF